MPPSVFSANESICEKKSLPPPTACNNGGAACDGAAGFAAGRCCGFAIFVAGLVGVTLVDCNAGVASEATPVTQQLPSPGQKASESMSSQKMANMPFMHSPSHSFSV